MSFLKEYRKDKYTNILSLLLSILFILIAFINTYVYSNYFSNFNSSSYTYKLNLKELCDPTFWIIYNAKIIKIWINIWWHFFENKFYLGLINKTHNFFFIDLLELCNHNCVNRSLLFKVYFIYSYEYVGAWLFKFGFLFLTTTIFSLFSLSYLGLYGTFLVNLIPLFLFWVSSIFFLKKIFISKKFFFLNFGKWFYININHKVNLEFYIDYISISFIVLTLSIALFVYCYCFSYFRYEPNVERLLLFINLFVISMIVLVSSGNFIVLFLGWELIGLTSFFLINFWSTRMGTLKAAFKAFIFNKISDVSMLISCILVYFLINDFSILAFNNQIQFYMNFYINILGVEVLYIELLSFFLLLSAFIKSAQFGAHIWLPDSMEAPVPASALIHSATLVSAGVYLLLRFNPLFELSTYSFYILPVVGSFTAFFGGICAAYQSDIKRILAYSTISHCGFLMVTVCTNICEYTLLYLYIHGFFKAAVFLCVGNVIRFSRNYQDFKRMGLFYKYLPFECFASFICLLNLSGLPFTLGFYIKHVTLLGLPEHINYFVYLNVIGGALCGVVYSFRLFYYVFFDFKKSKKSVYFAAIRNILKSYFYSNTTLASNNAIFILIIVSYLISLVFFNLFLFGLENNSELVHSSFINSNIYEYFLPSNSTLKNISYVNWFIIYVVFLVYLTKWRYFYNYSFVLNKFYFLINFSIFISILYNIIIF